MNAPDPGADVGHGADPGTAHDPPDQTRLRQLADEQAALRRVATLVAGGAQPAEVFTAVADELGQLIGAEATRPAPSRAMADFMQLAATAIANAQAEQALRDLADTQAALRRLAMLVARGEPPEVVFAAVTREALRHFGGDTARMIRYELDGTATLLANEITDVAAGLLGVIDELREISRGIHPAILSTAGLRPALRALGRRSAIPVNMDVRIDGRLPGPVEVGAYYVVSEMQVSSGHQRPASQGAERTLRGSRAPGPFIAHS
jgi:hypothetical protein